MSTSSPHIPFQQCSPVFSSPISTFLMHYHCFLLHFTMGEDHILINPLAGGLPVPVANPFFVLISWTAFLKCESTCSFPNSCVIPFHQTPIPSIPLKPLRQVFPVTSEQANLCLFCSLSLKCSSMIHPGCLSKLNVRGTLLLIMMPPQHPFPDSVKYPLCLQCASYIMPSEPVLFLYFIFWPPPLYQKLFKRVDSQITWGLRVSTLCSVENLQITYSQPSISLVLPHLQFHIYGFKQTQSVMLYYLLLFKNLHKSGPLQFKSLLLYNELYY